jgi:hypothetical protein
MAFHGEKMNSEVYALNNIEGACFLPRTKRNESLMLLQIIAVASVVLYAAD